MLRRPRAAGPPPLPALPLALWQGWRRTLSAGTASSSPAWCPAHLVIYTPIKGKIKKLMA